MKSRSPATEQAFFTAYDELLRAWQVPIETVELTSEYGTTHVNACGPAEAPPLVLLAGHGATSPVWFDPTDCFIGLSTQYVARSLPLLLRPTVARYESFLRWETQGIPLEPAWVTLAALAAAEYPTARVVRPRRPELDHLDALVVVAGRTKAHDPHLLAQRATELRAHVVRIDEATHHSLPAAHTDELSGALLRYLGES